MRVAIIVLNWNNWRDLKPCLESLQQRTYAKSTVIVVDNGSTDGSPDHVRREFPEVDLIALPDNLGFSAGNNVGMRHALEHGYDAALLLNNDTEVAPDLVEPLVETAQRDRHIGMVGSKIYYHDQPERIWSAGGHINPYRGRIWHRGLREMDGEPYDAPCDVDYLTGCALLVTRTAMERVGLLDEAFTAYGEDCQWCRRVREHDMRLVYEPRSRVWHKISASSGGHLTIAKIRRRLRGQIRFFREEAPTWSWPWIGWSFLVEGLRVALKR